MPAFDVLTFDLPDPRGRWVWQVRAVCEISIDSAVCDFIATYDFPEEGPGNRSMRMILHLKKLFLEVEDDTILDQFIDAIEQSQSEWLLRGFVGIYRWSSRTQLLHGFAYQVDKDDVSAFIRAAEGTELDLSMREVEGMLFALARVRTPLQENHLDTPIRLPVIRGGTHPAFTRNYSKLMNFYERYAAFAQMLPEFSTAETGRILNRISRLEILGTQALWELEHAPRASKSRIKKAARGAAVSDGASRDQQLGVHVANVSQVEPALAIVSVELRNIRCFEHLKIGLLSQEKPIDWALLVGDNSRGKSTLLRAIALGLCNEADAAALLKAVPGRMLRKDSLEGHIEITLTEKDGSTFVIRTDIQVETDSNTEVLRRTTSPSQGFPWERIFVCGYGPQRTRHAQSSYERYSTLSAVRSLFDYEADLQNPEVILLRQTSAARARMERKLRQILMLEGENGGIEYSASGVELSGPWGRLPLSSLSDGYRSTFQWVLDLIGWLIYAGRFERDEDMAGIVLIDELEQHLHPRWQRYVISQVHRQFPGIQFITSTHTPLVAAGIADLENAALLKLEEDESGATTAHLIDPRTLRGQRADQVLTSQAFGLATSRSPGSTDDIARYSELGAKERTTEEEAEYQQLAATLESNLAFGETPFEQTVEQAVRKTLDGMLEDAPDKTAEFELKKQLRELFRPEEPS